MKLISTEKLKPEQRQLAAADDQVERLESALAGALRAGDLQVDQLARLSQLNVRQRRAMWRAFCLLKQRRYDDAIATLEAECLELHDRGAAR